MTPQTITQLDTLAQANGLPAYSELQAFVTKCERKFHTETHVSNIIEAACNPSITLDQLERTVRQTLAAVGC